MREPVFKLLLQYIEQLYQYVSGIGFYDEVIKDIEAQKAKVLPAYNGYADKLKDQKYVATLSPPEQQALGQNELNLKHILSQMDDSVSHLLRIKWTYNIKQALWYLDDLKITIEDILGGYYNLAELGKEVKAKTLISQEKMDKSDYSGRAAKIQIAIGALRDDVLGDEADYGSFEDIGYFRLILRSGLGKVFQMLQREIEDIEANGMPNPHEFLIPDEVIPEVPDAVETDIRKAPPGESVGVHESDKEPAGTPVPATK